jgi:hypothetical protein
LRIGLVISSVLLQCIAKNAKVTCEANSSIGFFLGGGVEVFVVVFCGKHTCVRESMGLEDA